MPEEQAETSTENDAAAGADRQQQALSTFQTELARLSGKLDGIAEVVKAPQAQAAPAKPPETTYVRSQLREMVNNGTITEDAMDEQLEKQLRQSITATAEAATDEKLRKATLDGRVLGQIESYMDRNPKLKDKSSALYQRVQREFADLVAIGDSASSTTTELKALKIALGPLSSLKGVPKDPDTFEDTGGSGEGRDGNSDRGWSKGLSVSQKGHYEKLVGKGIYKGYDDPSLVAELKVARRRAA